MKAVYLLSFCVILCGFILPQAANGQWYKDHYDVESISDLTDDQYNVLLVRANRAMSIGKNTGYLSLGAVTAGIVTWKLFTSTSIADNLNEEDGYFLFYSCWGLVIGGIISYAFSASKCIEGSKQKSELESAFGKNISQISIQPIIGKHQNKSFFGAQLTFSLLQD